jgi:AraC-like DNA-binding protein
MPLAVQAPLGFAAWRGPVRAMQAMHSHGDIELNYVVCGEVEYFLAGRSVHLSAGTLAAFWAGMPHILAPPVVAVEMIWLVLPLAWFLQWGLPAPFTDNLLRGMVQSIKCEPWEVHLFERWSRDVPDLESGASDGSSRGGSVSRVALQGRGLAVALEVEACLRRCAAAATQQTGQARRAALPSVNEGAVVTWQIARMEAFMSAHFREEIDTATIAAAVKLHPRYAMQLFKSNCGVSLWEYVLRLRISHAQYLLLSTDRTIEDIAGEAGFVSRSRFYAAFARFAGGAPRAWREAQRSQI